MYDWLHALLKKIDYNRYLTGAALLSILFVGMAFMGCESTVASLVTPGGEVTRLELAGETANLRADLEGRKALLSAQIVALEAEVTAFNTNVELAVMELDRQDEIKLNALNFVSVSLTALKEGTFNPAGLIPFGIGVIGSALGWAAYKDKRRTDGVLAATKTPAA